MKNDHERIVITGVGAITPIGSDPEIIANNLLNGRSGIKKIDLPGFENLPVSHAGIVEENNLYQPKNPATNKTLGFAVYAVQEALKHSKISSYYDPMRIGLYLGTEPPSVDLSKQLPKLSDITDSNGDIFSNKNFNFDMHTDELVNTNLFPQLILSKLSLLYRINGPCFLHLGTCAASAQSIGESVSMLKNGDVDAMIAGGISSKIDPISIMRLIRVGALAPTIGDPTSLSKPFNKSRCGFTISEGGAVFILERLDNVKKRGGNPIIEIVGHGGALDGYSITDPHPESLGMILSMKRALQDADLEAANIDYLNAHGTSTLKNDLYETRAIKEVFGPNANSINISSTKSIHGHLMSAAGAMETLVSLISINKGFIPPTINLTEPDERCDLNYTPNISIKKELYHVMSNSFGLGGQNYTLIFKKYH